MRWPAKFVAKGGFMARGSKSKYTSKQKRKAEHIEEGYEKRGVGRKEAARRAWATVNKSSGGGKKSGSGRAKKAAKQAHAKVEEKAAVRRNVKLVSVAEPGIPSTAIAGSRDSEEITLKLSRRDSSALARDDARGT